MKWIYREYRHNWNLVSFELTLCLRSSTKRILDDLEIALQSDMWASASHNFSDSDTLIVRRGTEFEYWLDDGFLGHRLNRDEFLGCVEAALTGIIEE